MVLPGDKMFFKQFFKPHNYKCLGMSIKKPTAKRKTQNCFTNLSIIFNLKISRFLAVSSWLGTRDTRHLMALMMADRASFLASFLASFFSSSSVRFSKKAGTTSCKLDGKKCVRKPITQEG